MRIWDIEPKYLCRKHLLAEHRELHGLWNILTIHGGKGGYAHHPETIRWIEKTTALYNRHELLVQEFTIRGYRHLTPLDKKFASGSSYQDKYINTISEQIIILRNKHCDCFLHL
jgi:hypothetical protein